MRSIRNDSYTNTNSFHDRHRRTRRGWRASADATCPAAPARRRRTAAACRRWRAASRSAYADSFIHLLGVISQTNVALQLHDRRRDLPRRRAGARGCTRADEYELYVQDSWRVRDNLTVTGRPALQPLLAAVRSQRPAGGAERQPRRMVRPARGEHARRHSRRARASASRSSRPARRTTGPASTRGTRTTSRRASSAAWTPSPTTGWCAAATGMVYDRIGAGLATIFDTAARSACRPTLDSRSATRTTRTTPGVRFQGINDVPATYPGAPAGGFPATPAVGAGVITHSIDDSIRTPYSHSSTWSSAASSGRTTPSKRRTSAGAGAICSCGATSRCR